MRQYEHTIFVWDRPCQVLVHWKPDDAWVAVGDCMGVLIQTQDQSVAGALLKWQEATEAGEV